MPESPPILVHAAQVVDATVIDATPGALLLQDHEVVAAGSPQHVGRPKHAVLVDLPGAVLIPGLVNSHAHLDLSHVGPIPYDGDFPTWADGVRARRAPDDHALAASVHLGIEQALRGGTVLIGDIAGAASHVPLHTLRSGPLPGVSFLEVFGNGGRQGRAIEQMVQAITELEADAHGVRLGLQPHAPYSCGPDVYRAAAALQRPLATHLAETREELQFTRTGDGPLADMLRDIGVWDDSITGTGLHPVDHLADALACAPWIVAHANYIEPHHLEMLELWSTTVTYCPRASAYFQHEDHSYRQMLSAGVNVALGTDSILCLDTPDRLSILDEMRLLYQRDGTDPRKLLSMATNNGARALGFSEAPVTFRPGPVAGVLALTIDPASSEAPLIQALQRDEPPRWIIGPGVTAAEITE